MKLSDVSHDPWPPHLTRRDPEKGMAGAAGGEARRPLPCRPSPLGRGTARRPARGPSPSGGQPAARGPAGSACCRGGPHPRPSRRRRGRPGRCRGRPRGRGGSTGPRRRTRRRGSAGRPPPGPRRPRSPCARSTTAAPVGGGGSGGWGATVGDGSGWHSEAGRRVGALRDLCLVFAETRETTTDPEQMTIVWHSMCVTHFANVSHACCSASPFQKKHPRHRKGTCCSGDTLAFEQPTHRREAARHCTSRTTWK